MSSIPVLIAVAASLIDPRLAFLDPVAAIIVAAFIIKVGLEILFTNVNDLLDTGITKEKIIELKKIIKLWNKKKCFFVIRLKVFFIKFSCGN